MMPCFVSEEVPMKIDSFYDIADDLMAEVFKQSERETNEIFGNNENLPDDEAAVIFNEPFCDLSQPGKLQALVELRGKKGAFPN